MLRSLRGPSGRPTLRARVIAALIVIGALIAAAPVLLVPLGRVLFGAMGVV